MPEKAHFLIFGYLLISVLAVAFAPADVAFMWVVGMPIAAALASM